MKCRGRRLKSCCCCVDLRAGCFFLAIFEMFTAVLGLMVGEGSRLLLIGRFAYMLHLIGSLFLLMSCFWIEILVVIYLGANIFHLIFCTAFLIDYALSCHFCVFEVIPSCVTLAFTSGWWHLPTCDAFNGCTIPRSTTRTIVFSIFF
ncbi:uncharacterized protein [Drosophila kikkawai]|uniref:Uncharacterized protein isoform X2 n=1 Tax=Drosophila kikkawai TaxID=30033 RepID=A0ABM4GI84_DROKI